MKLQLSIIGIILIPVFSVISLGTGAVKMQVSKDNGKITLAFFISENYGIQKDGPHEVVFYQLKSGQEDVSSVSEKIKKYGKKISELKNVKFSGVNAKEDKDYFSNVLPITAKQPDGNFTMAVRARVYYCSFLDSFCSVETIESLIH